MASEERKQSKAESQGEHSSLENEEKYLTASYAAMMAEMEKDDYDFEDNEEGLSDEEAEMLYQQRAQAAKVAQGRVTDPHGATEHAALQ